MKILCVTPRYVKLQTDYDGSFLRVSWLALDAAADRDAARYASIRHEAIERADLMGLVRS